MENTLIIDTSYGSTVGVLGHEPKVETDSRTHVERLQVNIAQVVDEAGLTSQDIDAIVVGIGPAPFTGLRAGVVTAKALGYATGARLFGQNVLKPQAQMARMARNGEFVDKVQGAWNELYVPHMPTSESVSGVVAVQPLTLAVNDARRRQLYFALYDGDGATVIDMDIDYPAHIAERVNDAIAALVLRHPGTDYAVDVVGHGSGKYADAWNAIPNLGHVVNASVFDMGAIGLRIFADSALAENTEAMSEETSNESDGVRLHEQSTSTDRKNPVEPLYLRRPDVSVPNPLKRVLTQQGSTGGTR